MEGPDSITFEFAELVLLCRGGSTKARFRQLGLVLQMRARYSFLFGCESGKLQAPRSITAQARRAPELPVGWVV